MATLSDVCPHHETERGAAADNVLGRTGSEFDRGVREGFREQSWKGCLRASLFADTSRISAIRGSKFYH